ncbi:hypothetical protein LB465_04370 [Salegentibacter sp. LM13S]|nr:hypothetical protein [Salegentibacter lacus]MBZ9630005.1 hypothetical protein [Salegentibacter lacus]
MNIQEEKISLAQLLMKTNDPELIRPIREILKKNKPKYFWDELSTD